MDVIHVAGEVRLIADEVFSETPLPEIVLTPSIANERNAVAGERPAEPRLDGAPAPRIVVVAFRQDLQRMKVIGQHDHSVDMIGPLPPDVSKCVAQRIDVRDENIRPAVAHRYGEEVRCTRKTRAAVTNHKPLYPGFRFAASRLQSRYTKPRSGERRR